MVMEFVIIGIPHPQGDPKPFIVGRGTFRAHASLYQPRMDASWKELVLAQCLAHRPPRPIEGPVRLDLIFGMPIPQSMAKRDRQRIEAGEVIFHAKKPDRDHLQDPIMDMLQHAGFFKNDSQVAAGDVLKIYAVQPGVRVRVKALLLAAC